MQFRGSVDFFAEQTAVWKILTTPDLVSQCTPRLKGWSELENSTQFQLQFTWGSGSSIVTIPVLLIWQTISPPTLLGWRGQAQMGRTLIPLQGEFHLSAPSIKKTALLFTAQIEPPNKLLQQMIQTTAPRLIDSFFSCLKKSVEAV